MNRTTRKSGKKERKKERKKKKKKVIKVWPLKLLEEAKAISFSLDFVFCNYSFNSLITLLSSPLSIPSLVFVMECSSKRDYSFVSLKSEQCSCLSFLLGAKLFVGKKLSSFVEGQLESMKYVHPPISLVKPWNHQFICWFFHWERTRATLDGHTHTRTHTHTLTTLENGHRQGVMKKTL